MLALLATTPVIEAGREQEIVALFAPHKLGGEVIPAWRLMNVRVQPSYIEVEIQGPGRSAHLRLDHPSGSTKHTDTTPSFAITRGENAGEGDGKRAVDAVIEAIRKNDGGKFWRTTAEEKPAGAEPAPAERRPISGIVIPALLSAALLGFGIAFFVRRRRAQR